MKSYLLTGTGDLLHLHTALLQMLENKERHYTQEAARQEMRQRRLFLSQSSWLDELCVKVTYQAVDLLSRQHRLALAAMPSHKEPKPLQPCRQQFTQQYGLPCAHIILQRLQGGIPLELHDVHPRWWLEKPLVGAWPVFYVE